MKNTLTSYSTSYNWGSVISTVLGTNNRLYIGYFGLILFPLIALSTVVYVAGFIMAPPVDIDGIREPVAGSL
jgi:photosystem II P680 reaction center D1 protein